MVKKPTAPPKKPAVKAVPKAKPPQIASRPTTPKSTGSHLIFKQGDAKLTADAKKALDGLAAKLNATPKSRMQLLAYAGEPNLSASKARRLSLSRALSVRSYLIKKGVRSTRIDVRALGNKTSSGVPNRVDLKLVGK
jgi:outer membrane protein OmpA-like peptidoglycan-associated protein